MVYCPTGETLVDFYTKSLQGNLFRKFRDMIMDLEHISISERNTTVSDQECIGSTVGTELNKPLPTEIIKSDNIATEEH